MKFGLYSDVPSHCRQTQSRNASGFLCDAAIESNVLKQLGYSKRVERGYFNIRTRRSEHRYDDAVVGR